ncbi:unnamed protein product [Menidia menidia]|uniref:(Atlantic silverside) hypothetical protein n=1 Tax=Menidia menidia TaxID=238744 RepID=A0A8S4B9R7_9TELE|nr:unnamed protein product [Menidia menidia]
MQHSEAHYWLRLANASAAVLERKKRQFEGKSGSYSVQGVYDKACEAYGPSVSSQSSRSTSLSTELHLSRRVLCASPKWPGLSSNKQTLLQNSMTPHPVSTE